MAKKESLTDFQEQWDKIVDKAQKDYNSLSKAERVWFNIQLLMAAVENGGMISFFYNSQGEYYYETIEDLEILKHKKIIKLLEKMSEIFPNKIVPKDWDERNEVIDNMPDDEIFEEKIDKIDDEYFKLEKKLEEDLIEFIKINGMV